MFVFPPSTGFFLTFWASVWVSHAFSSLHFDLEGGVALLTWCYGVGLGGSREGLGVLTLNKIQILIV